MNDYFFTVDFGINSREGNEAISALMSRVYDAGVESVVVISNGIPEARRNLTLTHPKVWFTLGVHPHRASTWNAEAEAFLKANLSHPRCFAIGECGLDFNRDFSPRDVQTRAFEAQVILAKTYHKFLYLHCRDAWPEFMAILKKHQYYRGIVHCFTGTLATARELISLGFRLGITGWIHDSRRNQDLVAAIAKIPLESLVVETDSPYMPRPGKKTSSPEDTAWVVGAIATLRGMDTVVCGRIIYENSLLLLEESKST